MKVNEWHLLKGHDADVSIHAEDWDHLLSKVLILDALDLHYGC